MDATHPSPSMSGHHPWLNGVLTDREMLIIAGGYRCGTTSMFTYLAAHPEVNPSLIKEPAFFFSLRLKERPQTSYPPGHEAWAYRSMFRKRGARVLLEGTSNYLNDSGCAARIASALPRAKVVLLLREPIARLVSWYKFLRLQGQLDHAVSFEAWIRQQLSDQRPVDQRPYLLQAVEHCRYSVYVKEFLRVLGRERVLILWFDELKRDPLTVMQRVCSFIGINPVFYEDYTFPMQNESMRIHRPRAFSIYRKLHRGLVRLLKPWPRLQHEFKVLLFGYLEPVILWIFTAPADPVQVDADLRYDLRSFFRSDLLPLQKVTGQEVPWAREYEDDSVLPTLVKRSR